MVERATAACHRLSPGGGCRSGDRHLHDCSPGRRSPCGNTGQLFPRDPRIARLRALGGPEWRPKWWGARRAGRGGRRYRHAVPQDRCVTRAPYLLAITSHEGRQRSAGHTVLGILNQQAKRSGRSVQSSGQLGNHFASGSRSQRLPAAARYPLDGSEIVWMKIVVHSAFQGRSIRISDHRTNVAWTVNCGPVIKFDDNVIERARRAGGDEGNCRLQIVAYGDCTLSLITRSPERPAVGSRWRAPGYALHNKLASLLTWRTVPARPPMRTAPTRASDGSEIDVSPADFRAALMLGDCQFNRFLAATFTIEPDGQTIPTTARVHSAVCHRIDFDFSARHRRFNYRRTVLASVVDSNAGVMEVRTTATWTKQISGSTAVRSGLNFVTLSPGVRHD
ncbi:hypothetical protein C8J26_2622 [Sphingomonas aurantiaca]|uniref:Uncharacterized protein n=1 Tax=Sphingomonas aurantiaca TaxID=185949 RepID=A0A2T5GKD0_9SPHN|nr:hypothetical protein C8J26_2622 [Sphingomonas aurantiaca]